MKRFLAIGVSVFCLAGQSWAARPEGEARPPDVRRAAGSFEAVQKRLGIPLSEGTVVDASGRRPAVILIQDVHRHPEAQQHIRAIILSAMAHLGAKEIYLEGAWTHGQTADYPFSGLEDPDTYRANVAAYQAVEKDREDALREIDTAQLFENAFDADASPSWPLIKRLIQLRLKPAEYAEYARHPFCPAASWRASPSGRATASALARAVESAELFYQLASRRSDIFLAQAKRLHQTGPQVLVVGGFHTAGMAEKLREQGISYVVLSPRITQSGFEDLYSQGMHQTISALKLGSGPN
jgi:hypothetical protein